MTEHKIIFGDSRSLNQIKDKSVQLIITSPPYWQLKDYGTEDQIGFNDSYEEYMKRRRLDEVNPKENDNEIIELTDEELDEIFTDDDFDNGEEAGEIRSFYFSNPDPYAKVKPRPDDAPKREFSFDEKGNIVVKNPSAFWLPDVKIVEEHGGTEYTVTGSYEGTETLDRKLRRIMEQNAADDKNGITEDADE